MLLRPVLAVAVSCALGVSLAPAQEIEDPIGTRQALMKATGAAAKVGGGMAKGEMAFDPVVASLVLATFNATSRSAGHYFPEGSETGQETKASPKIWEDRAGFDQKLADFAQAASAAHAANPQDLESFKTAFGDVAKNCKACHETYRVEKD